MKDLKKYQGIFPAFYACYDEAGAISPERTRALTEYLIGKGVTGLYVGGSSGECIYQSVAERKLVLENVMAAAKGRIVIIAHVACNNTADSMELAAHAESLGVDAIAAIPPIYFHLPPYAIAQYWNDISSAAPHTDFIIYNIPQLAGVALSSALLREMPQCTNIVTTGGKASEELQAQLSIAVTEHTGIPTTCPQPKIGEYTELYAYDRPLRWWRMPSTSRAYPLKIEKKAAYYSRLPLSPH